MIGSIVDPARVRAGFPCTVRYQPGNPQNSIVVAEGWSGLREGLPHLRKLEVPGQWDMSRGDLTPGDLSGARPGRG
jgi:hypothetical protein